GEADLMVLGGPSHLAGIAVGDPIVGTKIAEEVADDRLRSCRRGGEDGAVLVVEDPQIPVGLADTQAGLIRLQRGSRKQLRADRLALLLESLARRFQDVDESAFADVEA